MKHELFTFIKPHGGKINMKSLGSCSFLQQEQVIDLSTVIIGSWKVVIFSWFKIRCHLQFIIVVVSQCYFTVMPPPPQIVYEITHIVAYITSIVYYWRLTVTWISHVIYMYTVHCMHVHESTLRVLLYTCMYLNMIIL